MATDARLPPLTGNPLLARHRRWAADPGAAAADRDTLLRRYSFAIPTDEALASIVAVAPGGVVELGAGTGCWARLLHERGVDVIAYDLFVLALGALGVGAVVHDTATGAGAGTRPIMTTRHRSVIADLLPAGLGVPSPKWSA